MSTGEPWLGAVPIIPVGANGDSAFDETNDAIRVNVVAGSAGGVSMTDDDTFTPGSSSVGPVGFFADETGTDTVDEGDVGIARMDTSRRVLMRLVGATDANRADVDASGHLQVDLAAASVTVAVTQSGTWDEVGINDSGNKITVDWNGTDPPIGAGLEATALRVTVATDSTGVLSVDDNGASLSVDWNGTQPVTGSGTATGALRVELPTNGTGVIATVGAVTAITNALPAGTNALGKLLPPDIDVTTNSNYAKKYYTNAGAVTDGIIWSPASGKRWHIHTIAINVSAACTLTLEDDKAGGDEAIYKAEFAANSGIVMTFPEKYPWASGEDAADLIVTTTAGNVYITCSGFEI